MLNAEGLKRHEDRDQDLKDLAWKYQTDVKLLNEPGKRHVPDFYTPPRKKDLVTHHTTAIGTIQ